jgi:hypothetical protein
VITTAVRDNCHDVASGYGNRDDKSLATSYVWLWI